MIRSTLRALSILALLVLPVAGVTACNPDAASPKPAATLKGDDNRDGVIDEDESGWDCKTMGNKICGPNAG